jgi:hypothetical protein
VSNHLRISLAEWLWRMSEEKVPYQARSLAVHAVLFKVTGNDELARLCGMDSMGRAEQTFNKWKKFLSQGGWVLLSNQRGGRGMGIEVSPAYKETPVEFTDVSRRDPGKFNPRRNVDTGAENTEVSNVETGVKTTETGVISATPSAAHAGVGVSNIYNKNNNLTNNNPTTTVELDAPREGEVEVSKGVFVNCETVRHKDFMISIAGVEMQLATAPIDMTPDRRKEVAKAASVAHALQWALEIANGGKPDKVVPPHPANFIRGSVVAQHNKSARNYGPSTYKSETPKMSNAEKIAASRARAAASKNYGGKSDER